MEDEPLVKETGIRLMSEKPPQAQSTGTNKAKAPEPALYSNRSKENLPNGDVRFKAETSGNTTSNKIEPDFDSIAKKILPENSMAAELQKQESEKNNHQLNNVSDEQKRIDSYTIWRRNIFKPS